VGAIVDEPRHVVADCVLGLRLSLRRL